MPWLSLAGPGVALALAIAGGIWWGGGITQRVAANETAVVDLRTEIKDDLADIREQLRDIQRFLLEHVP